jgi:predicted metal-dependent phosphoesterase TrpH
MDHTGVGVPALTESGADLHLHSTASDGAKSPAAVVRHAAAEGLACIALTDHDSVAGYQAATDEGARVGVTVMTGCELSVQGPAGELHLLAYGFQVDHAELAGFLAGAKAARLARAATIVRELAARGVAVTLAEVEREAAGAPIGRPHVARALIARGVVQSFAEAFDRLLGQGRPAFVAKELPALRDATALVRRAGGVTSAAHLRHRGTRRLLSELREQGVDAVEVVHPSHSPEVRARLDQLAGVLGLLRSGGSDWHGAAEFSPSHGTLGALRIPLAWVESIRRRARERGAG